MMADNSYFVVSVVDERDGTKIRFGAPVNSGWGQEETAERLSTVLRDTIKYYYDRETQ